MSALSFLCLLYLNLKEKLLGGVHSLDGGLIHKALRDPAKAAHKQALLQLMSQALGLTDIRGNQRNDQQGMKEVEVNLLSDSSVLLSKI